jgi:hypothetical protein
VSDNEVGELSVIETGERGIEFGETVRDGEVGAIGKGLAAFEFKGVESSAATDLALFEPLSRIRLGPPPFERAGEGAPSSGYGQSVRFRCAGRPVGVGMLLASSMPGSSAMASFCSLFSLPSFGTNEISGVDDMMNLCCASTLGQ